MGAVGGVFTTTTDPRHSCFGDKLVERIRQHRSPRLGYPSLLRRRASTSAPHSPSRSPLAALLPTPLLPLHPHPHPRNAPYNPPFPPRHLPALPSPPPAYSANPILPPHVPHLLRPHPSPHRHPNNAPPLNRNPAHQRALQKPAQQHRRASGDRGKWREEAESGRGGESGA